MYVYMYTCIKLYSSLSRVKFYYSSKKTLHKRVHIYLYIVS